MEIILGREEGNRRLHCIADGRMYNIGKPNSVPSSVSRKHCKVTIVGDKLKIENLKPENITYVDGNQVISKTISKDSTIQLGTDKFTVPLAEVLASAMSKPKTFSLVPLKKVWEDYDARKMAIQDKSAKNANRQRLQGILSMLGMCVGFIPSIDERVRMVIVVLALLVAIYFFLQGARSSSVQKQLHDLDDEFAGKYKCPNPECGKPFGGIPYRQIEYNKQCFACGCKYTH